MQRDRLLLCLKKVALVFGDQCDHKAELHASWGLHTLIKLKLLVLAFDISINTFKKK